MACFFQRTVASRRRLFCLDGRLCAVEVKDDEKQARQISTPALEQCYRRSLPFALLPLEP